MRPTRTRRASEGHQRWSPGFSLRLSACDDSLKAELQQSHSLARRVSVYFGLTILGMISTAAAAEPMPQRAAELLVRRCLECHSGNDPQGKLDLTSRTSLLAGGDSGPAVTANDPSQSLLWQRVADDEMPPKKPLTEDEKQLLESWIAAGTPYAIDPLSPWQFSTPERAGLDWWSLQPLRKITPPAPLDQITAHSPIDAFHQQDLQAVELSASLAADRRVLIRRVTYDLVGLPPTPEEIDGFLADEHPDAYERLVDRLLASPHYGERWARHWLDVVRFGESNGFERDLPRPAAWHYRDWVINALNDDISYPEFVRRQIAGNLHDSDDPESLKAAGFLVAGPHDTVVPVSEKMRQSMRFDELEDILGTIGQTFLGLTVNCARCHDHKFDPVSQTEYYQLTAVLAGVDHGEREYVPKRIAQELASIRPRIEELAAQLREQEAPLRKKILAAKSKSVADTAPPTPLAAWDFTKNVSDQAGQLTVTLHGTAKQTETGLVLDGQSAYAATSPLVKPLREKTLEAKVRLANLQQQGGGVIGVQNLDGGVFDAIVFGEQETGRWMAGSNFFQRTQSFQADAETQADREFVDIAIVYRADGTISAYRNGQPYGRDYRSHGPQPFAAERAQIVFGLRHAPAGGNRLLSGVIAVARLYDRALTAEEVAASAAAGDVFVTEAELRELLAEPERRQRTDRQQELQSLREREARLTQDSPVKVYTAALTQPGPVHFLRRGSVADPGDEVSPASLSALPSAQSQFHLPMETPEAARRAALAEWITAPDNALATRTIVNRLWHYHFGDGFVETPNDLGFNGGRPAHPELFEWLCNDFLRSGGGIKRFHRQVVTAGVYRQTSTSRPEAVAKDAGNRMLWRMSPRRLEAEAVRDAMLSVAGELNDTVGGPSYQDFNSYFFKGTQFYDPIDVDNADVHRRTVYRMWARGGRSPFLDTFDCPDPSTTTPKRSVTTTPLQALSLMNNAFAVRMAERFARRVEVEGGANSQATIAAVYLFAYGRTPREDELKAADDFVSQRGLVEFCRVILNSSEFLYVE